jgi:hypothetical protein
MQHKTAAETTAAGVRHARYMDLWSGAQMLLGWYAASNRKSLPCVTCSRLLLLRCFTALALQLVGPAV